MFGLIRNIAMFLCLATLGLPSMLWANAAVESASALTQNEMDPWPEHDFESTALTFIDAGSYGIDAEFLDTLNLEYDAHVQELHAYTRLVEQMHNLPEASLELSAGPLPWLGASPGGTPPGISVEWRAQIWVRYDSRHKIFFKQTEMQPVLLLQQVSRARFLFYHSTRQGYRDRPVALPACLFYAGGWPAFQNPGAFVPGGGFALIFVIASNLKSILPSFSGKRLPATPNSRAVQSKILEISIKRHRAPGAIFTRSSAAIAMSGDI